MQEVISYIQKAVLEISNALEPTIQATVKIKFYRRYPTQI